MTGYDIGEFYNDKGRHIPGWQKRIIRKLKRLYENKRRRRDRRETKLSMSASRCR